MPEPATAARRPSPRPRLRLVDDHPGLDYVPAAERDNSNSEVPVSGSPEVPPAEIVSAGHSDQPADPEAQTSENGLFDRARHAWAATTAYWTPPRLFTDQPASLADLAQYAKAAPWTAQQTGIFRTAGTGYYRWAAYPVTVMCRYTEWVWQRPGRLAAHTAMAKLFALTGPGTWVVDHIVYPAAHTVGHILL